MCVYSSMVLYKLLYRHAYSCLLTSDDFRLTMYVFFLNCLYWDIQGEYKLLSEDFAKPYFHKYWTEIHDFAAWTTQFSNCGDRKTNEMHFVNSHIFRISYCSYMFRRISSAILRQPNVILLKLYVCYIINAEQVKAESVRCQLSVGSFNWHHTDGNHTLLSPFQHSWRSIRTILAELHWAVWGWSSLCAETCSSKMIF
jgi:hypothetical protein